MAGVRAQEADSAATATVPRPVWRPGWVTTLLPRAASDTLLTRSALSGSSAMLLSDALSRESNLGILSSGCSGAWDLPYAISPGTERLSLALGGLPIAGPAVPEAPLAMLSPLALQSLVRLAPDPLLDPLGGGQDGILWGEPIGLAGGSSVSAVRLTEGPSGAATEDLVIGRESKRGQWWGSYAHARSDGRPVWILPRYSRTEGQNLGVHLDRASRFGPLALDASDRGGRFLLASIGKLEWRAQYLSGGWQFAARDSLRGEARLTRRNDGLHAWGAGGQTIRRTNSTDAIVRARWQRRGLALSAAGGVERVRLFYREGERVAPQDARIGLGVAMGGTFEGPRGVVHATAAWTDPWWGEGFGRVHLLGAFPIGARLGAELEGWNTTGAPFVPRAEGDENALLEEGVILPGGEAAREGARRRVLHAESRLRVGGDARRASVGAFVRRLQDGIGLDPDLAEALRPDRRDTVGVAALLGNATLAGARIACRLALPLGARIEGDAEVLFAPAHDRLPVLTPREQGRAVLAIGHGFFGNDLRLEGRLIAQGRGDWSTPYGISRGYVRWDAELHGEKGAARFFFALRHLTDATQDSGTYGEGAWMPLPYRSSQIGVEWRFAN